MTRVYFLIFIYCCFSLNVFSQNDVVDFDKEECGTIMSDEMTQWLIYYTQNKEEFHFSRANDTNFIPVKIHLVGDDDCNGFFSLRTVLSLLCDLNIQFNNETPSEKWHFYLYEDVNYICNTNYYQFSAISHSTAMINSNNTPNVLNLYFVDLLAGYCGYFYNNAVLLRKACSFEGNSLVPHEIGHYFSLPHTFSKINGCEECVDGSNCDLCGDLFCDTPADYLNNLWECPYNGSLVDACNSGSSLNPDHSLFMSYSYQYWCRTRFSNEQQNAMVSFLKSNRPYILDHPSPLSNLTSKSELTYPIHNSININPVVSLSWKKQNNTQKYLLNISACDTTLIEFQKIVSDTFFLAELGENCTYRWAVKALNEGYLCSNFSETSEFKTGENDVTTNIENSYQSSKIFVYPNPVGLINNSIYLKVKNKTMIENQKLSLTNNLGIEVFSGYLDEENSLEIPNIQKGIYYLSLQSTNKRNSSKIIVIE